MTPPVKARALSVLELIGNTPLVRLAKLPGPRSAAVLAKLEARNPSGSVKDRVALALIEDAERRGVLRPGGGVVEASSGNTAIALALVGTVKGYRVVVAAPEEMPLERRRLLTRLGAEVRLSPASEGMAGASALAKEIAAKAPGYVELKQFENPATVEAHRRTTAKEVLRDTGGRIDCFVTGVGTGGTLTGVGEVLKAEVPAVRVVAVQPARSPILTGGRPAPHRIYGLAPDFVPPLLNRSIIDEVVSVPDEEAQKMAQLLAKEEGLLVGVSSGANVYAALRLAERLGPGKTVVTILPDTGERYLSILP